MKIDYCCLVPLVHESKNIFQEQERNVSEVSANLREADNHVQKLKEDIRLRDEELSDLREMNYNLRRLQEQFPILEAQVRQFNNDNFIF